MTQARLSAVGYCARMTEVGDWAFQFALALARRHDTQLDIFFFPTSPCEEHEPRGRRGGRFEISDQDAIEIERQVRFYYDELLGDYVKVGFRLCLGDETPELRRCLFDREYDVLVLAYEKRRCLLGERTIEEFSERMQCPVVLVGPGRRDEIYLNDPAKLRVDDLGLGRQLWRPITGVLQDPGHGERPGDGGAAGPDSDDVMASAEWLGTLRLLNRHTGMSAFTWDRRGTRRAVHDKWCNHLCPVIQADRGSAESICGESAAAQVAASQRDRRPIVDRCVAGLVRIHAPVFVADEYAGSVGCCGGLAEGEAVEVDAIAAATGLSTEAVTRLSKETPHFSRGAIEILSSWLQAQVTHTLARIADARQADRASA